MSATRADRSMAAVVPTRLVAGALMDVAELNHALRDLAPYAMDRWNSHADDGHRPGGDTQRRSSDVSDPVGESVAATADLTDEQRRTEVTEAVALLRSIRRDAPKLTAMLKSASELRTPPAETSESKDWHKPGAGICVACGRFCVGGLVQNADGDLVQNPDRIKSGLCPAHYTGLQRAKKEGLERQDYILNVRTEVEIRSGRRKVS